MNCSTQTLPLSSLWGLDQVTIPPSETLSKASNSHPVELPIDIETRDFPLSNDASGTLGDDLKAVQSALKSGDISSAQDAFSKLSTFLESLNRQQQQLDQYDSHWHFA